MNERIRELAKQAQFYQDADDQANWANGYGMN